MHRRFLSSSVLAVLLFFAGVHVVHAQEKGEDESAPADALGTWKLINTALFAAGLGYLIYRYAPAFFQARSVDIQKAIQEATGLKMDADFRHSEIDRKMATLADEVRRIREQGSVEMEREHQRVLQETQEGLRRVQNSVNAEIEAFRQQGIRKVRQQTARAALTLAAERLRAQAGAEEPEDLVQDFVHLVERGKSF